MTRLILLVSTLLTLIAVAEPASAEIFGLLETPDGFASQIGNVQGWAYTTTPGAELVQPFDVLVNGVKKMEVPCCSERGDVKGEDPDIPLQTGFSGVTNWAREAGGDPIAVQVRVRDTMGGEKLLTQPSVAVYGLASFPFSSVVEWGEVSGPVSDGPQGGLPLSITSRCTLSNTGVFTPGSAELVCTNLVSTKGDGSEVEMCAGGVRFGWDKASQGFKQVSDCEVLPRWTDNGDGTATDNTTGLVWELKTDDGSIHDVDNHYDWSTGSPWKPDGTAFVDFLGTLNGGESQNGVTIEGCFADKCDWRLPTVEELKGILIEPYPCGTSPCTTIPGETVSSFYWSSSTNADFPSFAWTVSFNSGHVNFVFKSGAPYVRAVRGGS